MSSVCWRMCSLVLRRRVSEVKPLLAQIFGPNPVRLEAGSPAYDRQREEALARTPAHKFPNWSGVYPQPVFRSKLNRHGDRGMRGRRPRLWRLVERFTPRRIENEIRIACDRED
jgi:hypothetical protein